MFCKHFTGQERDGFLTERQPAVFDSSLVGYPDLILSLLTDSKFNSKRSIKYLIHGFYGRLQAEDGRVFVP